MEDPRSLFDSAVQASVALGEAVRPSFGPNGIDVLLETSDGHVSCSNCGRQILSSLSISHPVGLVISKSVTNYFNNTGDGSKKMLLILSATMRELSASLQTLSKIEVSRALLWLNQTLLPELTARLRANKLLCRTARDSEDLRCMLLQVATSCYRHCYSREVSQKLGEIFQALIHHSFSTLHNTTPLAISKYVDFTRKNMAALLVHLPGHSVSTTRTIPGLLLDYNLIHPIMREMAQEERQTKGGSSGVSRRLLCLLVRGWSHVSEDQPHNHHLPQQLCINHRLGGVAKVAESFSRQLQESVSHLKAADIGLILSCDKLPSLARHSLKGSGILAIEVVPEDFLDVLCECCSLYPLPTIHEMRDSSAVCGSAVWLSLSLLSIGDTNKQFVCLDLPPDVEMRPVSVVLCAPTAGICHQLQQRLYDTLLAVGGVCYHDDPPTAVLGGGAWEMALIRELELFKKQQNLVKYSPRWAAVNAFQKGLLSVPLSLLTSSQPSPTARNPLLRNLYSNTFTTTTGLPHLAVDCINGALVGVDNQWPVLEPFSSQCHLLHAVLSLATQLTRLDLMAAASSHTQHST